MNLTPLINLVTLIVAISMASERLVTFLKTIIPALAGDPLATSPNSKKPECIRQTIVMVISYLAALLTTVIVTGQGGTTTSMIQLPIWLIALLAGGGSAFWNNVLGYLKAAKDISIQKNIQQKAITQQRLSLPQ